MGSYKRILALITGIIFVVLWLVVLETNIDFNNLSVEQLEASGYYVYVLPEKIQEKLNWARTIKMKSFDFHCITQMDSSNDHWNPIQITYSGSESGIGMTIWISPYDAMFDRHKAEPVTVISEQILPYATTYKTDPAGRFQFVDELGNDIVISSQLSMETTLSLITQLVQVGYKGTTNPWEANCR